MEAGAKAGTKEEIAKDCEVVVKMLPNSPHVKEVVCGANGLLEHAQEGLTIIDMSSIAPLASQEVAAKCAEKGVSFLEAPVSGGEPKAIDGTLSIMCGVGNIVLRDRRQLSQDGILIIVMTMDKASGTIVAGPDIVSRGFVYVRESEALMEEAREKVKQALDKCEESRINEWSAIKSNVRDALGRYLYERTKRRPMILPIIMEI